MNTVVDLRRRVCQVAHGALIIMLAVQASLDDIEGALADGQVGLVAAESRRLVLACLRVRQLATHGEPSVHGEPAAFDPFEGVPGHTTGSGMDLVRAATELRPADRAAWLDRLRAFAAETERQLGLPAPLPVLRSPEGMFKALGLVRQWSPLVDQLGLPPLLPPEWTTTSATGGPQHVVTPVTGGAL